MEVNEMAENGAELLKMELDLCNRSLQQERLRCGSGGAFAVDLTTSLLVKPEMVPFQTPTALSGSESEAPILKPRTVGLTRKIAKWKWRAKGPDECDYLFTRSRDGTLKRWALAEDAAACSATFESRVAWYTNSFL
ncbi:unnamed protein product [Fraxinus pennsylvanica]|uniref:Uncharacterized protein n=1 Tax=Fraxinus pennsylvanica TaxID=56036 RepID=A0AAD1ZLR7_9LAMI|nr:unnamed protein product [Fraxinus pennsylvanica]